MSKNLKQTMTHIATVAIMLVVSCIYFAPVLSGDVVIQGDIQKAEAMSYQQHKAAEATGEVPAWNPAMFSGMPGYQTATRPQKSVFSALKSVLIMRHIGLERNIGVLWLYLIGFYIALIAFGCNPWVSLFGALAFGLGSYNIIIVEAGHITKAWAMAMMAPSLAGMVLCFRSILKNDDGTRSIAWKRMVWGLIIFTLAVGLQITFNHIQITFYTVIAGVIIGLTYLVYAIKEKWFKQFLAAVGLLLVGCLFAAGGNYRHLTVNQEYAKYTMRGGSEISVKPSDLGMETVQQQEATQTGGLDIDYAFSWSYGIGETYTLIVPGAMGGGSGERVADDSEWARRTGQTQAPLYWGGQPFTSGPVYFGAIIAFLFLFGCIVVKGPERWWIIIVTLLTIIMSWGRNFLPVNEFLFNNLPLYNKFRTPSMSLTLTNVAMVLMAALAVKTVIEALNAKQDTKEKAVENYDTRKRMTRALYWAGGIIAGILLAGIVIANSSLTFEGLGDQQYEAMLGNQWPMFKGLLIEERRSLFIHDTWRSLAFVALAFITLWLFVNQKLKKSGIIIALLAVLTVADLWGVDRRYLNNDNFTAPEKLTLHKNASEQQLDYIAAANGDANYRVYDLTVNTFNDSRPSAFHDEIGGYSAAKLRRYQDLIDFYLGSQKVYDYVNNCQIGVIASDQNGVRLGVNEPYPVLDMLNARYMMLKLQNQPTPVRRNTALGNCWLVEEVSLVEDANAEILALNDFDPYKTAIIDRSQWGEQLDGFKSSVRDSSESIELVSAKVRNPDRLTYKSHTNGDRLAVFSEIFYSPDWRVYIDGTPANILRANYILRALIIPSGDHTIEFVNEAPTMHRLDNITLIISLLMLVAMAGGIVLIYRKRKVQ